MVSATEWQELKDDVKYIRKEIEGNGKSGLLTQVASLTMWKNITTGGLIVLTALLSYGMIKFA